MIDEDLDVEEEAVASAGGLDFAGVTGSIDGGVELGPAGLREADVRSIPLDPAMQNGGADVEMKNNVKVSKLRSVGGSVPSTKDTEALKSLISGDEPEQQQQLPQKLEPLDVVGSMNMPANPSIEKIESGLTLKEPEDATEEGGDFGMGSHSIVNYLVYAGVIAGIYYALYILYLHVDSRD